MKLSIIPSDGAVCENGVCYINLTWSGTPSNVHALQWQDVVGWIEYNDGRLNEKITELPPWAISAQDAWTASNAPPPPPTPEEIQSANKAEAVFLLQQTDWAATVDIADPQYSNPYLDNQDAFLAYRSDVRKIAVNPPTTPVTNWPTVPTAVWVYV